MRIALDVMGGELGCVVAVKGVKLALEADSRITSVLLVGQEDKIRPALREVGLTDSRAKIVHASEVLTMDDHPVEGIRKKKDSSMVRAIELVREGKADAVISPGNTGALVAGSMKLRRLEGVERPAITARMPSRTGDFVLLDAGANPVCEPQHLAQFAVMGDIFAREILGIAKPRVGVLSNGSEESKGTDLTRAASALCAKLDLNYIGYVEGFDLFDDAVDVVVADGFVGNIVLKTAESLGYAIGHMLKRELMSSPLRMLGAKLAQGGLRKLKQRMDPEVYGGAVLLGLNGNVIKAHGSAKERAIMSAIRVATEQVQHGLNEIIIQRINAANERLAAAPATPIAK